MKLSNRLPEPFMILLESIQAAGFRLPVVVEGDADWCFAWVVDFLARMNGNTTLWYSNRAPEEAWRLSENRINHELGREADYLVFDAFSGVNVDALASMSGTLKRGGCMLFLSPPLSQLSQFDDPFYQNIVVPPWEVDQVSHHYLARLGNMLESSQRILRIRQGLPAVYPDQLPLPSTSDDVGLSDGSPPHGVESATADQSRAIKAIVDLQQGHRNRPLVLQADRGRGKSAAIGLALKSLRGKIKKVAITAPRPESVETVFRFAEVSESCSDYLSYYAPDHLLDTVPGADLLVIDEAAAIAPDMLSRMLKHYSRVVMATTVQGYEGTGRGFEIRFSKLLEMNYPGWKLLRLMQPIRWQDGDWLEYLMNSTLMPTNKDASGQAIVPGCEPEPLLDSDITFSWLQFEAMPESELADVFDLLTDAHYRTRPADLRTLMDAVNIRSLVLKAGNKLLGIAMIAEEGLLPAGLSQAILSGQRRPRGQILPQTLAVHLGAERALCMRFWRIVRIAVQPQYQSRGLGSRLLKQVRAFAEADSIDALGSVFSATPDLLCFWQKSQMNLLRIGYTRESTTGGYSALVMQAISPDGQQVQDLAKVRFSEDLALMLMDTHRKLPVDLTLKVIAMATSQQPVKVSALPRDQQFLTDFLAGRKVYENGYASLWRWVWCWLNNHGAGGASLATFPELIILKIVQNLSWPEVIEHQAITGKKQARKRLKDALAELLSNESELQ